MSMEPRFLQDEAAEHSAQPLDIYASQRSLTNTEEAGTDALAEQPLSTDADELTTLLQQEVRIRRKEELITFAWSGVFLLCILWTVHRSFTDVNTFMTNFRNCFLLLGGLGMGMCAQLVRCSYSRKHSFIEALAKSHDVRQVGPLIQALRVPNTSVRNLAKRALILLLPTLRASDAARLGDSEHAILLRTLAISPNDPGYRDLTELFSRSAYRREVELRVAILEALQQVGSAKELSVVARLSRGLPAMGSVVKVPGEIQEAARECLPFLEVRANDQIASAQLLRASSAQALPDNTLLRPASTRTDALPEQLLRASEPNA